MNRQEEILHQQISEAWNNSHRPCDQEHWEKQRLICQWNNAESGKGGNKMITMGVKKGVPDWQWLRDNGKTVWIELKTETGTQTPEQIRFEQMCGRLGHEYHICRNYETFWKICGIAPPVVRKAA